MKKVERQHQINILLTGSTGFLGSRLLDLISSIYNTELLVRKRSLEYSENHYIANIDNKSDFSPALIDKDVVIHCAARAHVMNDDAIEPLVEFREVNTYGTLNLAKQAAVAGVKRFIFISSVKVNGEATSNMRFSAFDEHNPEDFYSISKSDAEIGLRAIAVETGMEVVIIRPPLVYGHGVKANFSALLNLVTKKIPLPLGSIKNNERSLVSVYNLVALIDKCIYHPNAANQTFLVSDDHDLSTTEMVKLMAKVQGVKPWLVPVPVWMLQFLGKVAGKSDIISRLTDSLQVDITHTKETLEWTPPYSVEESFAMCVQKPIENNDKIEK
jgi:UDP-glucose 4-epimerase